MPPRSAKLHTRELLAMQRCHSWRFAMLLTTTLWASSLAAARAQTTVAVTAPAPTTTVVAPTVAPAGGFFGGLGGCCAGCKAKLANSPVCALIKNALKPLSALTGGLCCGGSAAAGAAAAAGGPGAPPPAPACEAEAKIKADEAQAGARREAVRFLGTVDCHWYPEAEAALVASLRCDRSECVRMEAALALGRGCCCTKSTVEALRIAASGSSRDGNPGERCTRVRIAALNALETCLCNCGDSLPATPTGDRPENPPEPLAPGEPSLDVGSALRLQPYYARLAERSSADVLREARATLSAFEQQQSSRAMIAAQSENRSEAVAGVWIGPRPQTTVGAPDVTTVPTVQSPTAPSMIASQPRFVPVQSRPSPAAEIIARPAPTAVQLRRLPAPSNALPEPIYLGRLPGDASLQ